MLSLKRKSGYIYVFMTNSEYYYTFSLGNKKISGNTLIFNLPAGAGPQGSCQQTCPSCYARKAEKMRPAVLRARRRNLECLQEYGLESLRQAVHYLVNLHPVKAIRIHESGDFFSREYLNRWQYIAEGLKPMGIPLWTYSKSYSRTDIDRTDNLNLVESILPDGEINFGTRDYVEYKQEKFDIPICPATLSEAKQDFICNRDCHWCLTYPAMLFVQH